LLLSFFLAGIIVLPRPISLTQEKFILILLLASNSTKLDLKLILILLASRNLCWQKNLILNWFLSC
jgi:hypothetical protein